MSHRLPGRAVDPAIEAAARAIAYVSDDLVPGTCPWRSVTVPIVSRVVMHRRDAELGMQVPRAMSRRMKDALRLYDGVYNAARVARIRHEMRPRSE